MQVPFLFHRRWVGSSLCGAEIRRQHCPRHGAVVGRVVSGGQQELVETSVLPVLGTLAALPRQIDEVKKFTSLQSNTTIPQ